MTMGASTMLTESVAADRRRLSLVKGASPPPKSLLPEVQLLRYRISLNREQCPVSRHVFYFRSEREKREKREGSRSRKRKKN